MSKIKLGSHYNWHVEAMVEMKQQIGRLAKVTKTLTTMTTQKYQNDFLNMKISHLESEFYFQGSMDTGIVCCLLNKYGLSYLVAEVEDLTGRVICVGEETAGAKSVYPVLVPQ